LEHYFSAALPSPNGPLSWEFPGPRPVGNRGGVLEGEQRVLAIGTECGVVSCADLILTAVIAIENTRLLNERAVSKKSPAPSGAAKWEEGPLFVS
jgi:hypothetical protein